MIIKVTANDIKNGVPEDSEHCAIVQALKRQTGKTDVEVDYSRSRGTVTITIDKVERTVFNNKVVEWLRAFDDKEEVKPFQFTVKEIA